MRENWYYSISGQPMGPISLQQLQDMLPTLPPDDVWIWHESFPERMPARAAAVLIADEALLKSMAASVIARHVRKATIESDQYCSVIGMLLGAFVILLGCVVLYVGLAGQERWSATVLGFSNALVDVVPGAILFQIGVFIIWITRPRVHVK